jgi:crossover junction endodeoxyribonuclease RuvC
MIVLAIDPGSVNAGYALLQKDGRRIIYLASGVLKFKAGDEFLHRVKDIYDQTLSLISKHQPDEIALESLIFVKSPTALIKLAQSRGTMLAALTQDFHQKIYEYAPTLVKSTVTGHGHADKEAIQKTLKQTLGLTEFSTHDESDAIAIAFCHLLLRDSLYALKKPLPGKGKSKSLSASLAHKIKEA